MNENPPVTKPVQKQETTPSKPSEPVKSNEPPSKSLRRSQNFSTPTSVPAPVPTKPSEVNASNKPPLSGSGGAMNKTPSNWPSDLPPFSEFTQKLLAIFEESKSCSSGKLPTEGLLVEPDLFGFSLCTIDGVIFSSGDSNSTFSLDSISLPFVYLMCCEEVGESKVTIIFYK